MRVISVTIVLTVFLSIGYLYAQPKADNMLGQFKWNSRPILVFTDTAKSQDYLMQIKIFKNNEEAFRERHVIVLSIIDNKVTGLDGTTYELNTRNLRHKYDAQSGFQVILIGKDGGKKLQNQAPTPLNTFINLIDSMPMRQNEMSS